jgi:hypothetical protein
VHHLVQSALPNTTSFFGSKKSSLMALSMQVARHFLALRDKENGAQIP